MKNIYRVDIPEPSAERLKARRVLTVQVSDGWGYYREEEHTIHEGDSFEFSVEAQADPVGDTTCTDGLTFTVFVTFYNRTGSRQEFVYLRPERVKEKSHVVA